MNESNYITLRVLSQMIGKTYKMIKADCIIDSQRIKTLHL